MNAIEKLEKYIKDEGITQISGGIFEDQTRKRCVSGRRLKAIFGNNHDIGLDKLNEITINEVISNGKAKPFKFNDSSKKKGAFEEFLDSVNENNPIEVDYSRGFKR